MIREILFVLLVIFCKDSLSTCSNCNINLSSTSTQRIPWGETKSISFKIKCPKTCKNTFRCNLNTSGSSTIKTNINSATIQANSRYSSKKFKINSIQKDTFEEQRGQVKISCNSLSTKKVNIVFEKLEIVLSLQGFKKTIIRGSNISFKLKLSKKSPIKLTFIITLKSGLDSMKFLQKTATISKGNKSSNSIKFDLENNEFFNKKQTLSLEVKMENKLSFLTYNEKQYQTIEVQNPEPIDIILDSSSEKVLNNFPIAKKQKVYFRIASLPVETFVSASFEPSDCLSIMGKGMKDNFGGGGDKNEINNNSTNLTFPFKTKKFGVYIIANKSGCNEDKTYSLRLLLDPKSIEFFKKKSYDFKVKIGEISPISVVLKFSDIKGTSLQNLKTVSGTVKLSRPLYKGIDKDPSTDTQIDNLVLNLALEENASRIKPNSFKLKAKDPSSHSFFNPSFSFELKTEGSIGDPLSFVFSSTPSYKKLIFPESQSLRYIISEPKKSDIDIDCPSKVSIDSKFKCTVEIEECPLGKNSSGYVKVSSEADEKLSVLDSSVKFYQNDGSRSIKNKVRSCGRFFGRTKTLEFEAKVVGLSNINFSLSGESEKQYSEPKTEQVRILAQDTLKLEFKDRKEIPKELFYSFGKNFFSNNKNGNQKLINWKNFLKDKGKWYEKNKLTLKLTDEVKNNDLSVQIQIEGSNDVRVEPESLIFEKDDDTEKSFNIIVNDNENCYNDSEKSDEDDGGNSGCKERDVILKVLIVSKEETLPLILPSSLMFTLKAFNFDENNSNNENNDDKGSENKGGNNQIDGKNNKNENRNNEGQKSQTLIDIIKDFFKSDRNKVIALVLVLGVIWFYFRKTDKDNAAYPVQDYPIAYNEYGYYNGGNYY